MAAMVIAPRACIFLKFLSLQLKILKKRFGVNFLLAA
jgi:hypothetical protein